MSADILNLSRYSSNEDNNSTNIRGFYYDHQLSSRLLSVTLHANKYLDRASGQWRKWSDMYTPSECDSGGYGKRPLCTAVMSEDFALSIQNNWSNAESNNDLEGTFNNFKQFAPYLSGLGETLGEMTNSQESKNAASGSTIAEGIRKVTGIMSKAANKTGDMLTRSLVVNATRHAYYQGSVSNFNNLSLKFTLFPDYLKDRNGASEFVSIHDQLSILYPYMIGKFSTFTEEVNNVYGQGSIDSNGAIGEALDNWLGWQCPPGGLKSNLKNFDAIQDGTLKLQFGPYYSVDNLVIRDAQLSFSKQMIKAMDPKVKNKIEVMPLYCEVLLSFQPVTRYTDKNLKSLFSGSKTKDSVASASSELNKSLIKAEEDMRKIYNLS